MKDFNKVLHFFRSLRNGIDFNETVMNNVKMNRCYENTLVPSVQLVQMSIPLRLPITISRKLL
jgi:hypothetical protein